MITFDSSCPFPLVPVGEVVEVLDRLRRPVNTADRATRTGVYPYYGANGQVGTIDGFLFDEELVLVAEDGGFFSDPHRPISYRASGKCWVNNHAHVLRPLPGVDVEWLNYAIGYQDVTRFIKGSTRSKLNQKELKKIEIPLPSPEEQLRLVGRIEEAFERLREIHLLRHQATRESEAVLPSLLAECFGDLGIVHPIRTIDEVSLETRYGTSRRSSTNESGTPILRIPNVAGGEVNFEKLKWCDHLSERELSKLVLRDGDLLVVRTNGSRDLVGRCAVFHDKGRPYAYASYLIRIRPDPEKVQAQFLAFFLESTMGRDSIAERTRTSAGQYNINSKNLRTIPFPCPPLYVQRDLVEEMVQRRRVLNGVRAEHSDLELQDEALRQAILRKAFTGDLGVGIAREAITT